MRDSRIAWNRQSGYFKIKMRRYERMPCKICPLHTKINILKETKKLNLKALILSLLLCLLNLFNFSLALASAYNVKLINNGNIYNSNDFFINNLGEVIWCEIDHSEIIELCLYQKGTINKIATMNTLGNAGHFQLNNIGQIVWNSYDEQNISHIYLYSNNSTKTISDPKHSSDYPSINNKGQVVWVEDYGGLCFYENDTVTRIYNGDAHVTQPLINDNGWIAWKTKVCLGSQCTSKIYLYDKSSVRQIYQLDNSNYDDIYFVQLNNINQVAFLVKQKTVLLYDENIISTIYDTTYLIYSLQLKNKGSMVWASYGGSGDGQSDIFYYHNGQITQITRPGIDDYDCRINNKDQIVWTSWPTSIPNIFYYKNGYVSKISTNNNRNEFAKINDVGQIVWLSGSNICLATPILNMAPINYLLLGH